MVRKAAEPISQSKSWCLNSIKWDTIYPKLQREKCNLALLRNFNNCSTLLRSTILRKFLELVTLHISWPPSHQKSQILDFFPNELNGLAWNESGNANSQVPLNLEIQDVKHVQCTEILFVNVNWDNLISMYSSYFIPLSRWVHFPFNLPSFENTLYNSHTYLL